MVIRRARDNERSYIKYEESYLHNTALIALDDEVVCGVFEYNINSQIYVKVRNFKVFKDYNKQELLDGFIKELIYWHPYIKEVLHEGQVIKVKHYAEIFKINLDEIVVAQLTVDEEKLARTLLWIEKPEDVIISCLKIDGKITCIDGHTRLVAAYKKGFNYVYGYYEEQEDIEFYKRCLKWCEEANIRKIKDLISRIVPSSEHEKLWINRCQQYFKEKQ